ncbi:MAG: YtxH domain-containing protein [Nitrospira sp.]|nr:YtxH domain-containing protein [Nitrospira sp.]
MASNKGSAADVIIAFVGGAAMGVLAALVLAPESGPTSRARLRQCIHRAEDNLKEWASRAGEVYEEIVGQGKALIETKKSVLREAFEAGREAMRRELERRRSEGSREA